MNMEYESYKKLKQNLDDIELELKRLKRMLESLDGYLANAKENALKYRMLMKDCGKLYTIELDIRCPSCKKVMKDYATEIKGREDEGLQLKRTCLYCKHEFVVNKSDIVEGD